MSVSKLLDTLDVTLTSAATAVTLPSTFTNGNQLTNSITFGCLNTAGAACSWVMLDSATDSHGKTWPASDIDIPYQVSVARELFNARTTGGGGTLELAIWGK